MAKQVAQQLKNANYGLDVSAKVKYSMTEEEKAESGKF